MLLILTLAIVNQNWAGPFAGGLGEGFVLQNLPKHRKDRPVLIDNG